MVANVRLLGLSRKALLDTGSQISIIPLEMFQASLASGFNLDEDVEEIPIDQQVPVYDASGNKMRFKGAVRLTLQLESGTKQRIALFVMAGGDGMLVLGTNALTKLGINLMSATETLPSGIVEKTSNKPDATVRSAKRPRRRKLQAEAATVAKRVYLRPGETKMLSINRKGIPKEGIVWSQSGMSG
ncbi:hypothetical protein Y032_0171g322 [Ancylostoma ceylanicum]|uniref:Peptidase A2 domain-containing protein n=1 Tax=Ancylostoma ceylanicum TaxID=53326 RepID=A0A016SVF3_9BILA|nr:hypothetical protein Y032_0171g322 [Ancylostoma ceylanicum]